MKRIILVLLLLLSQFANSIAEESHEGGSRPLTEEEKRPYLEERKKNICLLVNAALSLIDSTVVYDNSYVKIAYPMGDVPSDRGTSMDFVIRAFRKGLDWDLQESMYKYRVWKKYDYGYDSLIIDRNIDHRRIENFVDYNDFYFDASMNSCDWNGSYSDISKCEAGDIIVFKLKNGNMHIAICVSDTELVHNIGHGQVKERIDSVHGKIIRNYRFWTPPAFIIY